MLTIRTRLFHRPLTFTAKTLLVCCSLIALTSIARAEDAPNFNLLLEPEQSQDTTYRQENRDKTINIMLYGLKQPGGAVVEQDAVIPKDKKALNAFFKQHWANIRHDYLGDNQGNMRVMAGDESFASKSLNENIGQDTAKMVGLTVPVGKWTVGGGYTWGEKNPALMLKTTEGFFGGVSYDAGRTGFQVSYLTSGQEIAGLEIGGTDIHYQSVMIGTSFRVNDRMGLTATVQYRRDDDPLTTGDAQAIFTVGTRWKF